MTQMPNRQTFSVEEDALMSICFLAGMSTDEIAEASGRSIATIALRKSQMGYNRVKTFWTAEQDDILCAMRAEGRTVTEIRKALGVTRTAVYDRLVKLGGRYDLPTPPKPNPMIPIVAELSRQAVPQYLDDKTTSEAIQAAGRALRLMLADPRLEIRLRPQ